jgi:enterochelin esterase-like enzyme
MAQDESYPEHPDSVEQPGVPKGKIEGPFPWRSNIYPGTVRNYWLYVPQQYQGNEPACAMIVQDGLGMAQGWKLPVVMDNLIHAGQMPVTIGIFIDHGQVPSPNDQAQPRFNRSFEYDSLGDRYARFLIEEILPEVNKRVKISEDPNDRAIAGATGSVSSGAQHDRYLRGTPGCRHLSDADPQVRTEAVAGFSAGWRSRSEYLRGRLVDGQPEHAVGPAL